VRAIIVAAGRGRRLGGETAEVPKCMVPVGGRPILHWQLDALRAAGATDFVIVRGYLGERIQAPDQRLRFVENAEWERNNILASLMFAAHEMDEGFLFSYSDIVFADEHARRLAASDDYADLVVDRRWSETYVGRVHHPVSEAELTSIRPTPNGGAAVIDRVGKNVVTPAEAVGEFIGLARFSRSAANDLRAEWRRAAAGGLEQPYGRAAHLRQAYLSDALNALSANGNLLTPVFIDGRWREIDTEEDLSRAQALIGTWNR
jgi:L-glutamine-phosphate cytidylyltransferase